MLEEGVTEPSGQARETECPTPHEDMVRVKDDRGTGHVESPCYTCGAAV